VATRLVPGHWEGDHIKGPGNRSAVGTLVERKSRYVMLVKLQDGSAEATLEGFTRKFRHMPFCMKKSLTYDQGREMARHEILAKRVRIDVYFAAPHSPWQRPTHENTNGLIREYLPMRTYFTGVHIIVRDVTTRTTQSRPKRIFIMESLLNSISTATPVLSY
jgi:IS30 family transposase